MTTQGDAVATQPHPSDGVLLALIDAEHDEERLAELSAASAHVPRCDVCRGRQAAIETHSTHVRAALASIPVPVGSEVVLRSRIARATLRRDVPLWRRPAWQAAAAAIILAGAAAASPVRQWLLRRREPPQAAIHSAPAIVPAPGVQPTKPSVARSAIVSFAPSGPDFTVQFDSLPAAGVLTTEHTTGAEISARAANGADADPLLVLPGVLRVRNGARSRASYVVSLPASVIRLHVTVAGDTVFDAAPPAIVRLDRRR